MDDASWVLRKVSSSTEMTDASDEFLSAVTASFPRAGTMLRMACGEMIRRISTNGVIPSACPAATCPRSTPRTADRMTSAMKGASLAASARPPAATALRRRPMCGKASYANTICKMSGVPRKMTA